MNDDPAKRTRIPLDLATLPWQFGQVSPKPWPASSQPVPFDLPQVTKWLPASVPGNVRSDLLAGGRIADPFQGQGLEASLWTETVDWWYRTRIPLGAFQPGQRAFIELDGVDYRSACFVDRQELGRHEGMFSRQVYELPQPFLERDEIELAVRIWGSASLPSYPMRPWERAWGALAGVVQGTFQPFDQRLAHLKAPMQSGWDFAPRLQAMGIWDDLRLVFCREIYLAGLQVQAEPLGLPANPGPARLVLGLELDSARAQQITALIRVHRPEDADSPAWQRSFSLEVPAGFSRHRLQAELPAMALWQPWERGEPCLYRLEVTLLDEEGRPLDGATTDFGVRAIQGQPGTGGGSWRFMVNGEPLFLRGANWVPVDSLQGRARLHRYEALLHQARAAGINFLRVWGGGGREKQAFYDLCDRLGILVWQEFPIACMFLDHLPRSAEYRQLLRQEATGMVRALRNHPSLFLWCGGNEFSPSRNQQAVRVLQDVVGREDGSRPWAQASPGPGDAHNWQVWHGRAPLAAYGHEQAPMVSEFGLQAAPAVDSLRHLLAPEEPWPPGPGWIRHKADLDKLAHYAAWFGAGPGEESDLESFVLASQRAQAAGLQVMIEHLRRRPQTGGLALWQWNEPWPAISWSVIDYFGRPKLAYQVLQRIMQPILVSLEYPLRAYQAGDRLQGRLWVVGGGDAERGGRRDAERGGRGEGSTDDRMVRAFLDDDLVHEQPQVPLTWGPQVVGQIEVVLPEGFQRLRLELWQGNQRLAENVYDLRYHDAGHWSPALALRRRAVDWILR